MKFESIHNELKGKGLDSSSKSIQVADVFHASRNFFFFPVAQGVEQFISTASILFYFLYNSQKAKFPVDFSKIQELINTARQEFGKVREA